MLRFILGKSGSGKTEYIYEQIAEKTDNGEENIVMLIPDQSSFETEKALLQRLGANKAKKVNVFGFNRLCDFVFEKTSGIPQNVLDDGTRGVIMSLALEQLKDKFSLFKPSNSLASVLLQTLSDCKKSGVTTDMLRDAAVCAENETFSMKLSETALAIDTFDSIVSQSYIDPLDNLTRLYEILSKKSIFENYTFYVDSFSGFTAQQLKVVRLLMNQSKEFYVALTLDPLSGGNEEVFETSHKTMKTLKSLAKSDFIDIKTPIILDEQKRFANEELSAFERRIFRNVYQPCNLPAKNIVVYSAEDIYSECEFAAGKIKELVVEHGYLYSDITVICHDTEPYNGILNVIFDKYEIPYFMDKHNDIAVKPVIRLINSIFRAVTDNFEREDVVSILKTGLTANTPDEINAFENYCYVWNVSRSSFKKVFTQNPSGFKSEFTEKEKQELATAEKVRKSVIEPLLKFKESTKDKNGKEIATALYNLLEEMDVMNALSRMYDVFGMSGDLQSGAEQIRIWNLFMQSLDKTVAVTENLRLSLKRFYELLSIQMNSIKYFDIPETLDSVTVTTAQRVRLSKQKASFLIGCYDGNFPATPHFSGVFSQYELNMLTLNDIKLGDDFSQLTTLETFMAYCCMTSASDKLYISYPMISLDGERCEKSAIVKEVLKIFPNLVVLDNIDIDFTKQAMYVRQPAFDEYAKSAAQGSKKLKGLKEFFESDSDFQDKNSALQRALDSSEFKVNNPEIMKKLFGENLRISASQIEKFSKCSFSYFCNYGLRVRERRKAEINPLEYGTLVHFVLERFFTSYDKNTYSALSDDEIKSFILGCVNSYVDGIMGGSEEKTQSFLYRISVLSDDVFILLKHIIEELSQSDFDVSDCELKIGADVPAYTLKLQDGINIAVVGSIDRVDVMKKQSKTYVRIIDYKTGAKTFELSDILYGLNLQMLLYLYSLKLNGKEKFGDFSEAGILYMPASIKPVNNADNSLTEEKIQNELDKNLKMNGLIVDDVVIVKGMDKSESGRYIPAIIKAGNLVSGNSLATLEQFSKIYKKIELTVMSMAKNLYSGNVQASPVTGRHNGCEYCPYDSVCCYHMSNPRNTFKTDNKEVYEQIDREINKGGEN